MAKKKRKSLGFRFLMWILRKAKQPSKFTYVGDEIDEPCVILSNHVDTSGPLSFQLYSGLNFTFWGAYQMNSGLVKMYKYQSRVFYHEKRGWNLFLARLYCLIASPVTSIVYGGLDLISTYPDLRFRKTLHESEEAVKEGKSLVIFPEVSDNGYLDELEGFHRGFLVFLRHMYKKGVDLPVVVTYFNKYNKVHMVGEKIKYSELLATYGTDEAICSALCEKCNELGKLSLGEEPKEEEANVA